MPDPIIDAKHTTLEDHIDILRGLDEQRRNSARLRNYGVTVLEKWMQGIPRELEQALANDKERFDRLLRFAVIAVDVLYRCCERSPDGLEQQLNSLLDYLERDRRPSGGVGHNLRIPDQSDH